MFGIGLLELVVIAVLGVLVVGPEKMPDLARQAAGLLKSAKKATETVRDELRENLGPDYADLEIADLHPRSFVRKHVLEVLREEDLVDEDDEDEDEDEDEDDDSLHDTSDDAEARLHALHHENTQNELTERDVS